MSQTLEIDAKEIRRQIEALSPQNSYDRFDYYIDKFLIANRKRYDYITQESMEYIRSITKDCDPKEMFVSFSGGKDSTVVSDLVLRALGTQQILHIYGDTTLEFPQSTDYIKRFRKEHPKTPLVTSRKDV